MLLDYHIHSLAHGEYNYEKNWIDLFINQACRIGMGEIGFSEHDEFADQVDYGLLTIIREERGQAINIRLGLELDYIPGREEYMAAMAARREYDYIIGSVHFINGWGFDHPDFKSGFEHRDIDEIYQDYAALLIKMADSRLFDVVGHIDLVKVWGHRPSKRSALHYLQPVLESIKNSGMAVEINSAGLRKPVAELYPAADVLQTMFDLNVPIIFGSDAHHPDQVGAGLPEACEAARKAGYRYLVRLSRRQRIITPF